MILATRLEVNLLKTPAHRPVYFPDQFALYFIIQAICLFVLTVITDIANLCALINIAGNTRGIFMAMRTVDFEGIIDGAALLNGLALSLDRLKLSKDIKDRLTLT